MKIYISGPITGMEDGNKLAFAAAAERLAAAGYEVINPHDIPLLGDLNPYDAQWEDWLRADITYILLNGVQGIAKLPGWENSRGALLECHMASELSLEIGTVGHWIKKEL